MFIQQEDYSLVVATHHITIQLSILKSHSWNALDFGDQVTSAAVKSSFSSSTRGFSFGGFPAYSPAISVVNIASKGNATKFGEMTSAGLSYEGCANSVRGMFAGGYTAGAQHMKSINILQWHQREMHSFW